MVQSKTPPSRSSQLYLYSLSYLWQWHLLNWFLWCHLPLQGTATQQCRATGSYQRCSLSLLIYYYLLEHLSALNLEYVMLFGTLTCLRTFKNLNLYNFSHVGSAPKVGITLTVICCVPWTYHNSLKRGSYWKYLILTKFMGSLTFLMHH